MDKELLRIVIITLGLLVMIGMVLWSFFRDSRSRRKIDFYDEGDPLNKIDDSLVIKTENDNFDVVPLSAATDELVIDDLYDEISREYDKPSQSTRNDDDLNYEAIDEVDKVTDFEDSSDLLSGDDFSEINKINEFSKQGTNYTDDDIDSVNQESEDTTENNEYATKEPEYTKAAKIPEIIQIHILALDYEGFSGQQLLKAFKAAKLTYGSLKIFEKLDENRIVKFSVASMVEPGTFPDTGTELREFKCPGIVFFLQPGELVDSIAVFDEYIDTIELVADKLDGVKLDSKRDPLTDKTISEFRQALS